MKKFLPLILLVVGIAIFAGVFIFIKNQKKTSEPVDENDESALINVPDDKKPVLSLIPTEDGHYLKFKVDNIVVPGVAKVDYLLEYQTAAGITQAVQNVEDANGKKSIDNDFLLGTESSGKFRYDEGVETGSLEIKYRNNDGKMIAKFKTDFHMQKDSLELSSQDGKMKYKLDKPAKGVFFVTMNIVGQPGSELKAVAKKDGYAVFASDLKDHPGSVQ